MIGASNIYNIWPMMSNGKRRDRLVWVTECLLFSCARSRIRGSIVVCDVILPEECYKREGVSGCLRLDKSIRE